MFCKKCNIVVHGNAHGICPECNGPIEQTPEFSHAESGNAIDRQKLKEFAPIPTPQPVLDQNPKYGAMVNIFIVFAVVIIAGVAAAYYFILIEPKPAKRLFDLSAKIAPLMGPQAQTDKIDRDFKPTVQAKQFADGRQSEPDKKDVSQPMAEPALLAATQTAAPSEHKAGTPSPAIKENKPAVPASAVASIEKKPAHSSAEEKKVLASLPQETVVNATMYCVNVSLCKLKKSADVVIKDLQKKGYAPAVDTITLKGSIWYRVTLGHFKTPVEAQNYARELQIKDNIKGFVVKNKY